jgi:hypothetical protein
MSRRRHSGPQDEADFGILRPGLAIVGARVAALDAAHDLSYHRFPVSLHDLQLVCLFAGARVLPQSPLECNNRALKELAGTSRIAYNHCDDSPVALARGLSMEDLASEAFRRW